MPRLTREFSFPHVVYLALSLAAPLASQAQQHLRDKQIHDADTLAWWHTTVALSDDGMEGRDTGSPAFQRAADYVANRFKAAGLSPAGENGGYLQTVPMHQIDVVPEGTNFTLIGHNRAQTPLKFLEQITIAAADNLAAQTEAPLTFRGYCGKDAMADIAGKIVVCFGTQRAGLPNGSARATNAREGGALGVVSVDDPYFTIEPPRWPYAYARSVTLRMPPQAEKAHAASLLSMRLSAEAFVTLLAGSGQDAAAILKTGGSKQPLPNFEIPNSLRVQVHVKERDISSPNIVAKLPGSDAKLRNEFVVIAAHLDGYGYGTPVKGDNLYNGTLDDAAYVALLIQTADDLKAHRLPVPKRSILFIAFTGEEKGLLGSRWFVAHPTVPGAQLAADVNLDQLRPLFPLNILTAEALGDTTLGATARAVAAPMHIEIRPDLEPERNLLARADQYPFLGIHVPAISFIFGYDPNTEAERRYREWYQVRYHRPQDDITQPMDFAAAAKFNTFFYRLTLTIANDAGRPAIYPTSSFAADKH
jgi:Zn-dependent M28 family amino/carboxypeptidase